MKLLRNIGLIATLVVLFTSCFEKDPEYVDFPSKDVDFIYAVAGDEYILDYYVVSEIQFTNTSAKTGNVTWDFGDGTTSNEANPIHKYAKAGTYQVKLTIDGVGSCSYPVMIYDIAPVLSVKSQSADVVTINDVTVDFNIFLPNPENLKVKYVWTFPEGTTNEAGDEMTEFVGYADENGNVEYPGKLKFRNIGSQRITLQTWFDTEGENRQLEDSYVNVQVGANHECKTLYYAALDGNIKALKLVDPAQLPEGTKNLPFDMGVKSGTMPFTLAFASIPNAEGVNEGWIYILDAGKQYTYINDENGVNGDGKINVMSADGKSTNLFVTNVGQAAFNDPFFGAVDGDNLIYTDRNTGVRKMALTTRGATEKSDYVVKNENLGYYNKGIAYGAISTTILKDSKGTYWWGKCYNGNGIFRFKSSDIYPSYNDAPGIPNEIVLNAVNLKAFTLDESRNALYVWRTKTDGGFYEYPLPADGVALSGTAFTKQIKMDADPINATDAEGVYVTQMAVDQETGYVYFGFNKDAKDSSSYQTGLKYYDPTSKTVVNVDNCVDKILGVTINDAKSKLF